jgi:hypothetical protein
LLHARQIAALELFAHGMTIARQLGSRLILLEPTLALPSRILLSSSGPRPVNGRDSARTANRTERPLVWDLIFAVKDTSAASMPSPVLLKMVNKRLAKLTRQYTAIRKGDPRALAIADFHR